MASVLERVSRTTSRPATWSCSTTPTRRHAPARRLHVPADLLRRRRCRASPVVIGHQTDMGGRVPGSNASDSTEIFQEGLRIPPLKLYERGVPNRTVHRIIEQNVRVPETRARRPRGRSTPPARWASASFGRLLARYGADAMHALHGGAARLRRAPDPRRDRRAGREGTYAFTDHLDERRLQRRAGPAHGGDHRARRRRLTCDWTGTSPQVRGAINSTLSFTKSVHLPLACARVLDAGRARTMPACSAASRSIAPEGTILNPRLPGAGRGARADRLPHGRRDARRARADRARAHAGGRRGRQHRALHRRLRPRTAGRS